MRNDLKWESSVEFNREQITQKIDKLEHEWQIKFPREYLEIVLSTDRSLPYIKNENGEWKFAGIILPKVGKMMIEMLSLKEVEFRGNKTTAIETSYNALKEALPQKVFPFAQNGSGDKLLFDYRKNNEPEIAFIDHEDLITEDWLSEEDLKLKPLEDWQSEKMYPVCRSFLELLDRISLIDN